MRFLTIGRISGTPQLSKMSLPERFIYALSIMLTLLATPSSHTMAAQAVHHDGAPVNVIFDTDMWNDVDDALALAMLHALHDRGEINLIAVTVSADYKWAATYVDLVNRFYGHHKIPLGIVFNPRNPKADTISTPWMKGVPLERSMWANPFPKIISEKRRSDGSALYPHDLIDGSKAREATALLREVLASQDDGSVIMIQVGPSTNLARLLASKPDRISAMKGRDLIKKKVRLLSTMAGHFREATYDGRTVPIGPEANVITDMASAKLLFSEWPTPIVASGLEVGINMLFPAYSIAHDFSFAANHPIADAYRCWALGDVVKWPYNRQTFDLTAVLYASRPDRSYFKVSEPGKILVSSDGTTTFKTSAVGLHRYLILADEHKERTLEAMVMLASQPPVRAPNRPNKSKDVRLHRSLARPC